jgi:hypothetical protein
MSEINKSKEFWEQQLEKLKASGLSRAQYCREHGINYSRFGYWVTRLCPVPSTFIPVEIQATNLEPSHTTLCTLELPKHTLKIHDMSALSFILERLAR